MSDATLVFPAPFDLAETLDSGQVFHWTREPGEEPVFAGLIGDHPVRLLQRAAGEPVEVRHGDGRIVAEYLGLADDLAAIAGTFPGDDPHLAAAIAFCPGLRILRQPAWECLATFITSSLKNIPAIRRMSLELRRRFGRAVELPGVGTLSAYPEPEALAAAGEPGLRACGLGYRARSLALAAERVASGEIDLEKLGEFDDDALEAALRGFRGVGPKVAACVALFGFGRLGAFPIDVWVERVLRDLYFRGRRKVTPRRIREFALAHFGPNRGYAQQFLFHHARRTLPRRRGHG